MAWKSSADMLHSSCISRADDESIYISIVFMAMYRCD